MPRMNFRFKLFFFDAEETFFIFVENIVIGGFTTWDDCTQKNDQSVRVLMIFDLFRGDYFSVFFFRDVLSLSFYRTRIVHMRLNKN